MRGYPMNPQLTRPNRATTSQRLVSELERLRLENEALRAELREASEREAAPADPEPEPATAPEVELLSRKIHELTRDLERVEGRTATEVEAARQDERARQLSSLGGLLDSVHSALSMSNEGADPAWHDGLEAIRGQLMTVLADQGASVTGFVGEPYDPRLHEGVAMVTDSGVSSGRVAQVVRHGIVLDGGRVARTAQVCIAA